jgi:hypothetical protein
MTLLERIARVEQRRGGRVDAAIADTCTERFAIAMGEIGRIEERIDALADAVAELRAKAAAPAPRPLASRLRPGLCARGRS